MNRRNKLIETVRKTIAENVLIEPNEKVLTAFSGGADSVCLLYVLNLLKEEIGFELFAAHLNHGLRGEAAIRDEKFVMDFCGKIGVLCKTERKDVRAYAKKSGISEEMAGREMRYDFFERVMLEYKLEKLAVGHHINDQAETVLQHLMRGSGADGLSGMKYKNGKRIRPLLDVSKKEILEFCAEEGLEYCTDDTNFETDYTRNKVRLELIPKMMEFNPNIIGTIAQTSKILADDADFFKEETERSYEEAVIGNKIKISEFLKFHVCIQRRIIRKMIENVKLTAKDISFTEAEAVLELCRRKETGKKINLGAGTEAMVEYGWLKIDKEYKKKTLYREISFRDKVKIGSFVISPSDYGVPEEAHIALRSRQNGDRIYPKGMTGSKKLKDFFIDEKVPKRERDEAVILTSDGEIAAVFYGNKIFRDRRFKYN